MAEGPVVVQRGSRALPCKAVLLDEDGLSLTDGNLASPPVIQLLFTSSTGGDPIDVTDEALPAGQGSEGNQFSFTGEKWQFNLKTKNYTAAGTYTILLDTGDRTEYVVETTCAVEFVVLE